MLKMASNLLKIHLRTIETAKPSIPFAHSKAHFPILPFHSHEQLSHSRIHLSFSPILPRKPISVCSSLSSSTPPTSKEEAILQAKTCLSSTLEKPLNNPKFVGKLKKLKQPRFRLEIPVIDDSPASLSQLALDVFQDLPIKRKGSPVKLLLLWPHVTLREGAMEAFGIQSSSQIEHTDISSLKTKNGDTRILSSADVAVFLVPEASQLAVIKAVTDSSYPKPVVIFNPKWAFEEESNFGELGGFVGSFEVIYSFMGLEVRGLLSKRKGVIFKCVRDGVVSGERWTVLVEEETGELKVVSRFKTRPSITEVENVLYNLMAINSPITKSAKFLKDLVSNVTGKKAG
ncbi:hypothetical protein I3843_11G178500 [Carya illinoinensis]|nr:hypothetical protein I3760_11G177600 [Carya illinoinensis]KAG7957500.1 hypothetical protein I3843_11G178500 [Carya illinoinensis]